MGLDEWTNVWNQSMQPIMNAKKLCLNTHMRPDSIFIGLNVDVRKEPKWMNDTRAVVAV